MPIDDEVFARSLRARIDAAPPTVPVDVPGAVRQGRRRRVRRAGAGAGTLAVGLAALAVGVPSVLDRTPDRLDLAAATAVQGGAPAVPEGATTSGDRVVLRVSGGVDGERLDVTTWTLSDQSVQSRRADAQEVAVAAGAAVLQEAQSEYLTWLTTTYQLSTTPDAAVVTTVHPAEWITSQGRCLRAAGWEVEVDDGGYSVTLTADSTNAFGRDQYVCAVEYPADQG